MDIEDLSLDWSPSHIIPSSHCSFLCVAVPPSDLDHLPGEKCSLVTSLYGMYNILISSK